VFTEARTVLRAVMTDFFFNCWCLSAPTCQQTIALSLRQESLTTVKLACLRPHSAYLLQPLLQRPRMNPIQILRPAIHPGLLSQRQPKVKHKVRVVNTSLALARLAVQVLLPKIQSTPPSLLNLWAQVHNSSSRQHRLTCTNTAIRD
jgi:hypothetical protein